MLAVLGDEGGLVLADVGADSAFKFGSGELRGGHERREQLRAAGLAAVRVDQRSEQIETVVDVDRPVDEGVGALPVMQGADINPASGMTRSEGPASVSDDARRPTPALGRVPKVIAV